MNIWPAMSRVILDKNVVAGARAIDLNGWFNGVFTIRIDQVVYDTEAPSMIHFQNKWFAHSKIVFGAELKVMP